MTNLSSPKRVSSEDVPTLGRGGELGPTPEAPCAGCSRFAAAGSRGGMSKERARTSLQRLQSLVGLLLFLSAGVAIYLLATDRSLWLLAVSHAVGLIVIVAVDLLLGVLSFATSKRAYVPSIAAALLGFVLQLGDVFTAPQYGLTIPYFAEYLFGLWAFDVLLALQLAILLLGVLGRPYAINLARRKTRSGRELNLTKRSFLTSLVAIASMIGLGVLVSSIKLPSGSTQTTATESGTAGAIANTNNLRVGASVPFDYPSGYPNVLLKKSDGSLVALSLLCTHVCCVCTYDPTSNRVYCPCHGSVFDANGNVLQGPASSALPQVQLRVDASGNVFPTGISNPGPCHV
jgi:Rieske Fe-S protein